LGAPFAALSPGQSLVKVKNLLSGQVPTEDELAAYLEDPSTLAGLIDV